VTGEHPGTTHGVGCLAILRSHFLSVARVSLGIADAHPSSTLGSFEEVRLWKELSDLAALGIDFGSDRDLA